MKTLLLSLIALVGLAAAAMAAPPLGALSPPETARSLAVPVAQSTLPNSGEVSEAIHAGTYTYLHAMKDGKGTWLAIPKRDVPVGAEIRYAEGALMKDFYSSSLKRSFEEVLFLGSVEVAGESAAAAAPGQAPVQALPPGHSPVPAAPAGHPPVPAGSAAQESLPNAGQVRETIAAGKYTYLHVTKDGRETWLAIPSRDVPVGAEIRYAEGAVMKDFHSGSLNRTFDEVLFLGGVLLTKE
ncbi:MAG: hypothetical protein ABFS30_05155 [Pseudomonadota bacterium]